MTHRSKLEDYAVDEEGCYQAMAQLEYEMKQSAKLFEYTKLLKEAATKRASAHHRANGGAGAAAMVQDSTYIIRLQSQLMKSMHSMGMLDNQLELYQTQCSGMAKSLREEIIRIIEGKSLAELRLMNELGTVHGEMREREEELNGAIEAKRLELAKLEDILVERHGHRIDEDEDGDNDSEVGEENNGPSYGDEAISAPVSGREMTSNSHCTRAKYAEGTILLDEEIEGVTRQIETLSTEKESMVCHLRMAIADKDEILRKMKKETTVRLHL